MIEQAKEAAHWLRDVFVSGELSSVVARKMADTIDALIAEVERLKAACDKFSEAEMLLTKVDVERERLAKIMQATVDAKEAADRFINKSKVDVEPVAILHPSKDKAISMEDFATQPAWVQRHWQDGEKLVPASALAALQQENEQWHSKWSEMEEASTRQFQRVVKLVEERDTLRAQLEQAHADSAKLREALEKCVVVMEKAENDMTYHGWLNGDALDAAIDAAREVIEKEDDREYCPRCNEEWSGTSCGIPNCGWIKGDIDE